MRRLWCRVFGDPDLIDPKFNQVKPLARDYVLSIQKNFHGLILTTCLPFLQKHNKETGKVYPLPDLIQHTRKSRQRMADWPPRNDSGHSRNYWKHQALPSEFYPIPGHYGGFNFCFVFKDEDESKDKVALDLLALRFCRIAGGSYTIYKITEKGVFLQAEKYDLPDPIYHDPPGVQINLNIPETKEYQLL